MLRSFFLPFLLLLATCSQAAQPQKPNLKELAKKHWVDSVYNRLNENERIGQLFMVAAYSGTNKYNVPFIEKLIQAHQIGGLIFMQGDPASQAKLTNKFQEISQVPLLLSMDAEWGLGMRLTGVKNLPYQMTLGATNDTALAYAMGAAVAYQCKRVGVHINFAPVVDVNNNPANPVINARSFGEDKYRVARMGIAYMQGMQDNGIMACAKHFPGHGDVSVDSHLDLPVINKSIAQLDSLELFPFRQMIAAGIQSIMVAHLSIPALETEAHVPTTLSKNTISGLLKNNMGFKGLVFTDALDMKGVAKYFNNGEADLRAFIAGNDVLLFSQDVAVAIEKIKAAVKAGTVSNGQLEGSVKKILAAKFNAGLNHFKPIDTNNITNDINQNTQVFNNLVAEKALTLVRNTKHRIPLKKTERVLQVFVGGGSKNDGFDNNMLAANVGYYAGVNSTDGGGFKAVEAKMANEKWDAIVITVGGLSFYPGKSYGLDEATLQFLKKYANQSNVIVALMGNAYALKYVCNANTLICGFEDNIWTEIALEKVLCGKLNATGILPVTPPCLK